MPGNRCYVPLTEGFIEYITVANPAAGAEWIYTVPAGVILCPITVRCTLTTAVAVANRYNRILFSDATPVALAAAQLDLAVVAVNTVLFHYAQGMTPINPAAHGLKTAPCPIVYLQPTHTIASLTLNIQAADQYIDIRITARTWRI